MKKRLLLLALVAFIACHKQEYYNTNPNAPTGATPALLLTGICQDVFRGDVFSPALAVRHITYYERPSIYQQYDWAQWSFGEYGTLRNVREMQKLAEATGDKGFWGLAHFFRAVVFSRLTERFGDVPFSEALRGEEGIDEPKYDSQEAVYAGILDELKMANDLLAEAKNDIGGDIIFAGKAEKWRRAANAFRLRLLVHLSKREGQTSIDVRGQFAEILADPTRFPLFQSSADNAQIVFNESSTDNYYPLFNNLSVKSLTSLEKGFVKLLKDRQDPRLFQFADPVSGQPAGVFSSYEGVDGGLVTTDQQNSAPTASKIHRRYYEDKINEPLVLIGFAEQEFLIAEGLARGWAAGDAKSRFANGVRASMLGYGIGAIKIEGYLNSAAVKFDAAKAVEQIAVQKHIALFMQSGWETFFEVRRTGFPAMAIGPGTLNGGKIPQRWRYPQTERDLNGPNVEAAIDRQFGGTDDINAVMWVLKN